MLDKKKVTHYQQNKEKATPQKRVVFYKGRIAGIGENCLSITSTTVNINDKNIKIKTYDDLAYVLFQVWKNSPPHYQNMIKPEYSLSGLHVSYSKKENFYYAANVFGEYEYTPPTIFDFPKPDYGINYDYKRKYKAVADKVFSRSAINFINLKKDSVFLTYNEPDKLHDIIKLPNDGIMVDFVIREQFKCGTNNNLDESPVYDGYPMPPVYSFHILKDYKIDIPYLDINLAPIPGVLKKQHFEPSIIIIKDKTAINYTIPLTVPHFDFALLNFYPLVDTSNVFRIDTCINITYADKIYFKKNTNIPISDYIKITNRFNKHNSNNKISNVKITGFSSIEGDSIKNKNLQQKRVAFVLKHLPDSLHKKVLTNTKPNIKEFALYYIDKIDSSLINNYDSVYSFYLKNKSNIEEKLLQLH